MIGLSVRKQMRIGMMNKLRLILALSALLLMSGCGTNEFLAAHDEGIDGIDGIGGVSGMGAITARSAPSMTVSKALRKARRLEKKSRWAEADVVFKSALAQHSRSKKLKRRYRSFKARHKAKKDRYEIDAMVSKARWLKKQHRYSKAIDSSYKGQHWSEVVRISKKLAKKGLKAMKRKRMNLAYRALSQSVKVNSNRATRKAYGRYRAYKERRDFARLVRKGRKMADISLEPGRL